MKHRLLILLAILFLSSFAMAGTVGLDLTLNGTGYRAEYFGSFGAVGSSVAVQADGRIVVGGTTQNSGSGYDYAAMRLLTNGVLDTAFDLDGRVLTNMGPFDFSSSIVIQADGKIVFGGQRYAGETYDDFAAVRYNPSGTLDNSFDGNGVVVTNRSGFSQEVGYGLALQSDGKFVVVGTTAFATMPGDAQPTDIMIVRYNSDASLDSTFKATVSW